MLNIQNEKECVVLLNYLEINKFDLNFLDYSGQFADEPFGYSFCLAGSNKNRIVGSGFSFLSAQSAILKTMHETIERLALSAKTLPTSQGNISLSSSEIDLNSYCKYLPLTNKAKIDITTIMRCDNEIFFYIPKEIVVFSNKKSPFITTSCGTSGGFDQAKNKLKALSELIEYDTLLLWFFGVFNGYKLNINEINDNRITNVFKEIIWFDLNIEIFEIINDIGIPVYVTFIIDKTGKGPAITCGSGVGIQGLDGLYHSIEEAFQTRFYAKNLLYNSFFKIKSAGYFGKEERLLYWANNNSYKQYQNLTKNYKISKNHGEKKITYDEIISQYAKKQIYFYQKNIADVALTKLGYSVIRIISPDLQSFYLAENDQIINKKRIKNIDNKFNFQHIQSLVPHPFP